MEKNRRVEYVLRNSLKNKIGIILEDRKECGNE